MDTLAVLIVDLDIDASELVVKRLGRGHEPVIRVKTVELVVHVGVIEVGGRAEDYLAVPSLPLAQLPVVDDVAAQLVRAEVEQEAEEGEGQGQDAEEDLRPTEGRSQ